MNRIACFKLLLALAGLGAASVPCAADERGTVDNSERAQPVISKRGDQGSVRVRFFANGRDYRLRLELNPRLERWSTGTWHQYAGSLEGNGKSWARLAIADTALSGVIYDGEELVAVEPAGNGQLTVYRVPELRFPQPLSFAGDSVVDAMKKQDAVAAPLSAPVEAETPGRKLEISAIGDAAFLSRYDSVEAARDAMLTRLNIVDGIFSAQVGVTIEVASVDVADDLSNSLDGSTDPSILLDSLGRLRQQSPSLSSRGLTHLFTGRNLDGDNVGIGYQATLCRARFSASLAQAHGSATLDGLISAHEIGHVFGAPHDGTGQCAAVPQGQFIMSPVLDSQATSFSQCSLDQMATLATSASCLAPLSPPDLALPASLGTQNAVAGANFDWRFTVANQGDRAAGDVRVTIQLTAGLDLTSAAIEDGSCAVQAPQATCDLASLGAGESAELSVVVRSAAAGTFSAHVQVVAADDTNHSNDEADGTLRVQAAGSPPPTPEPQSTARSGGGALDVTLLEFLGALLGLAARRRFSPRAATR
jgi:Metallo-peptidase family M12/Domain of unknown function DUF11